MRWRLVSALVLIGAFAPSLPMSAAEWPADGVPLPADAAIARPDAAAPASHQRFSGAWAGTWGGALRHVLVVEAIAHDGEARVIYAVGALEPAGIRPAWHRLVGRIEGDALTVGETFTARHALAGDGLNARYRRGGIESHALLAKIPLEALTAPGAQVPWSGGETVWLDTALVEDGGAIRLEAVLYRPEGAGPFPLAVLNHGSTGNGRNPALFAETRVAPAIAAFLLDRGWLVAFPQRRGRGRSDGLYDEGFATDRAEGYTGDSARSLTGAERALADVRAAVAALRRRPDVAPGRILLGGISRGGALSIAYAGRHPDEVAGVVNFVGGWLGEGHASAAEVNRRVFEEGAASAAPTLWLYGEGDPYYSIAHSRASFAAFLKAGGSGTFQSFAVPGGNGHALAERPGLWAAPLDSFLATVGR